MIFLVPQISRKHPPGWWFALWPLLALDAAGVSTFHTRFTRPQADIPNLAAKTRGRTFLVMPRFQHRFLVGKWFGGTCNVLNLMPTTSHDSHNNTQCFHMLSRSQAQMTLTTSRVPKKNQQLLRTSRTCPPPSGQKKHIPATTRINSDQNMQFGLFSVVGWVWQHQKFTKRQEQAS